MEIVVDFPPMYEEIAEKFKLRKGQGVIFAWGDQIFNPTGVHLSEPLLAHECVHSVQQGADPEMWWRLYLRDPEFRLAQELPAHQAEYIKTMGLAANRHQRRAAAKRIAGRLAGPLYGRLIRPKRALQLIKEIPSDQGTREEANRQADTV